MRNIPRRDQAGLGSKKERGVLYRNRGVLLGVSAVLAIGLASLGIVSATSFRTTSASLPTPTTVAAKSSHHKRLLLGFAKRVEIVVAVGPGSLTVRNLNDVTRTYTLGETTRYLDNGASVASGALVDGEHVVVRASAGSSVATLVRILPSRVLGLVVATSGSSATVTTSSGLSEEIITSESTHVRELGTSASTSAILPGEVIVARGMPGPSVVTLDATQVTIRLPHYVGTVTAKSGHTLTVQLSGGISATVNVTSSTAYRQGSTSTQLSAISVGSSITAIGVVSASNTMTAVQVHVDHGHSAAPTISGV